MLFSRRASDNSERSMGSTASESSRNDDSAPNSVPSLDDRNFSVESTFETPQESALFDVGPRASADTYRSTVASFDDLGEEEEDDHPYPYAKQLPLCNAVPATPQEFAEFFPSTRRLTIKHDDSTLDGNMNVRVDTSAPTKRDQDRHITLFHLRMYELRDRDFSVRRYGRDCGREVAQIKRKVVSSQPLQRSVSKALNSFRGKSELEDVKKLQRQDSGYGSGPEEDELENECSVPAGGTTKPTNTCTLEFSNYAHVDLTRRGPRTSKRYDFKYWGKSYSWKRSIKAVGTTEEITYRLVNNASNNMVAFIRPDPMTPAVAAAEEAKGGFVPPCSMWLKDSSLDPIDNDHADVADVIVTTGLVALADDCIKRKFHTKRLVHLVLPVPSRSPGRTTVKVEGVGPRRFIDEMFGLYRRPSLVSRSNSMPADREGTTPNTPPPVQRKFTI